MRFLASKEMSLACFVLNCIFAVGAFANREAVWFVASVAFATLCLHNYFNQLEDK